MLKREAGCSREVQSWLHALLGCASREQGFLPGNVAASCMHTSRSTLQSVLAWLPCVSPLQPASLAATSAQLQLLAAFRDAVLPLRVSHRLLPPAPFLPLPSRSRSFYFWVDIISTISILLDIPAIVDPIVSSVSGGLAGWLAGGRLVMGWLVGRSAGCRGGEGVLGGRAGGLASGLLTVFSSIACDLPGDAVVLLLCQAGVLAAACRVPGC